MTLLPSNNFGITGWPGNKYDVNEICAHPSCGQPSVHAHHMWPRSFIRKDYDWVRLPDGTIIGNRVGLCVEHHNAVTGAIGGHRAKLEWLSGVMWWHVKVESRRAVAGADIDMDAPLETHWITVGPLTTQPPVAGGAVVAVEEQDGEAILHVGAAHGHVSDDEKVCPVCGHHKKAKEPKAKLPPREIREWVVSVPSDTEQGVDILDGWIDDFAIPMGATDWSPRLRRYYVLVTVLAWANIHRAEFIQELAEAADRRVRS